ncbi:hypothetical protein FRC06_009563 [Ceratobasidium sp. 370]|nr:hypothetical protein FRC06_009563 [Ceratobasidium sp. 370]
MNSRSADENPRARIRPKPLRARVLLDGSIDPNVQWDRIFAEAEGADTLLVAGTSLPSSDVYGMVDEIAQRIRRDGGVVVLIDTGDLTPRMAHLLDFHLKLDIQQCARAMLSILQKHSAESADDIWEECYYRPVPLHALNDMQESDFTVPWEPKAYYACVVYITHGMSDTYQINDSLGVTPHQFLNDTTSPIRATIRNAKFSVSFMLACGTLYENPQNVQAIQEWIDR